MQNKERFLLKSNSSPKNLKTKKSLGRKNSTSFLEY